MAHPNLQNPFNLAMQHHQAGRLREAEQLYRGILARNPRHADAAHYLGVICQQLGRGDAALDLIRRATALNPNNAAAVNSLGIVLFSQGQLDEAIAAYRRAIALDPNHPDAYNNLGNALRVYGDLDAAVAAYQRSIALKPNDANTHSNLGVTLDELGRHEQAIAAYRMSIAVDPQFANAHYNLAMSLLLQQQFEQGWQEYEWRWKCPMFPSPRRNFPQPQWDGEPLQDRTLLLHTEQGFGDTFQFIRYLPLVLSRAPRTHIQCQPELLRLLQANAHGCPVISVSQSLPAFDVHCPLMRLPLIFGTKIDSIPGKAPYLSPDPEDVQKWRSRISSDSAIKVGLVWAGSYCKTKHRDLRTRELSIWAPLARVARARFFSLQKGPESVLPRPPGLELIDFTAELNDFADTAALIQNLDLVVTVDTAAAHLAAALGKPVWVVIPFAPDFRWLLDRTDSPWYPTMRLFRQKRPDDWQSVINEVADALSPWIENGR